MRISYHKDTDSLYVHLNERPTDESEEIAENTVLHFDANGNVTGLEVYSEASEKVDLSGVETRGIQSDRATIARPDTEVWRLVRARGYRRADRGYEIPHGLVQGAKKYGMTMDIQKVS
jgi:uncharacterized protein YuzE